MSPGRRGSFYKRCCVEDDAKENEGAMAQAQASAGDEESPKRSLLQVLGP